MVGSLPLVTPPSREGLEGDQWIQSPMGTTCALAGASLPTRGMWRLSSQNWRRCLLGACAFVSPGTRRRRATPVGTSGPSTPAQRLAEGANVEEHVDRRSRSTATLSHPAAARLPRGGGPRCNYSRRAGRDAGRQVTLAGVGQWWSPNRSRARDIEIEPLGDLVEKCPARRLRCSPLVALLQEALAKSCAGPGKPVGLLRSLLARPILINRSQQCLAPPTGFEPVLPP